MPLKEGANLSASTAERKDILPTTARSQRINAPNASSLVKDIVETVEITALLAPWKPQTVQRRKIPLLL